MKKLLTFLVLAATAAGAWLYFRDGQSDAPQYQSAPVVRGDLTQMVTATGILNPVMTVQVGCQISGNIKKLLVDFNSEVAAGRVVAVLDPATYEAAVSLANADLVNAKAAARLAELKKTRKRRQARKRK